MTAPLVRAENVSRSFRGGSGWLAPHSEIKAVREVDLMVGRGEATVFIPIDGGARAIGRVVPLRIPEAELAIMLHRGPLADIDLTYGELGAHVLRHEISVEGPVRENYIAGFLDTEDPDQWETEIGWPIFRSDR